MQGKLYIEPTPHIYFDQLIDPSVYERVVFPDLPPKPGGRTGGDLYAGEPGYDDAVSSPGWSEIYSKFTSIEFVRDVLATFSPFMSDYECVVDPAKFYLEEYIESREQVRRNWIPTRNPAEGLFVRFDFQAGGKSYEMHPHVDHPRRVTGGVLFFSSADEEQMEGGTFALYTDQDFRNDRRSHDPKLAKEYPYRHNTGVIFLNCNTAFHGPTVIHDIKGLRRWVYYSISSQKNVWPFELPWWRKLHIRDRLHLR